jgi:hypothetical protein
MEWVRARLCKLQKGCTRLPADIAEILLKVALKHQKIKPKADYINNHILNVFKYIFNMVTFLKFPLTYSMKFAKIYSITKISSQISVNFYT